jgi:hypothetical protein
MIKTRPSGIENRPYEVAEDSVIVLSNGNPMFFYEGFPTDYASIPGILKFFLEWKGQEADAYLVHDHLYNYKGYRVHKGGEIIRVKRRWADKEMVWHMKRLGSPAWRRTAYYVAVRLFGWRTYGTI